MKKLLTFLLLFPGFLFAQSGYDTLTISEDVCLIRLTERVYVHVTEMLYPSFGRISSNGLLVVDQGEAYLFDTPSNDTLTKILVAGIEDSLHANIRGVIPNHWHDDCVGGLNYLHSIGVPSYAHQLTIDLTHEHGMPQPQHAFTDSLTLRVKGIDVYCYFLGGAHTRDNIVVWVPSEKVLFPGCMLKHATAVNLGNMADADLESWPVTLDKLLVKFSDARIVVPGHYGVGDIELIHHTKSLLDHLCVR